MLDAEEEGAPETVPSSEGLRDEATERQESDASKRSEPPPLPRP
jgi:hypothetical protein